MISPSIYERLADLVEEHGWRDGVRIILNELGPIERRALFWDIHLGAQAPWMLWVGKNCQDAVLNFDVGIGTTTVALSHLFPNVTGIFLDESRRKCAVARAGEEGRTINTVSIHDLKGQPSFQKNRFDLICLSNAQVWLDAHGNGLNKGERFLSTLLSLVTPRGMVYLGKKDGSFFSGLGFGSQGVVDRWLVSSLQEKSCRVSTRLQFYPTSGPVETVFEERGEKSWVTRCRNTLKRIVKGESYGLIIVKSPAGTSSGVIGDIVKQDEVEHTDSTDLRVYVGTANTLVGKLPGRIVRVPLDREALSRCCNNYETLQALPPISPVAIPTPSLPGRFGDLMYFEESKLPGHEPTEKKNGPRKSDLIAVQAFRYLLHLHTATSRKVILDEILFENLVGIPLKNLIGYCQGADKDTLSNIAVMLKKRLMGKETVLVRTHGDFKRTNLLVNETEEVVGVIDWDLSRKAGFPLMDLLWYLSYEMYLTRQIPFYQAIVRVAFEEDILKNDCVQMYWQKLCLNDRARQKIYAAMLLLYQFHEHLDHWHKVEEPWLSCTMLPILRSTFEDALGIPMEPTRSAL